MKSLSKRCLTCRASHNTLYYHKDRYGVAWIFCNKCNDSMDLLDYCALHGIKEPTEEEISRVVQDDPEDRELQKMNWPRSFIPLWQKEAQPGVDYLASRKIQPSDGMFYDTDNNGIVFPYYYENTCVGAQIRFVNPKEKDGKIWKITTVPGTKLGKLFYGWNQADLPQKVKYLVVTEGAFNAIILQQTFNRHYQSITHNPYRFIAASGSSIGKYRSEVLQEEISKGKRVIIAADPDAAGAKMVEEAVNNGCATHYTCPSVDEMDWNDIALHKGEDSLIQEFINNLKRI